MTIYYFLFYASAAIIGFCLGFFGARTSKKFNALFLMMEECGVKQKQMADEIHLLTQSIEDLQKSVQKVSENKNEEEKIIKYQKYE